jgi:cytochrome c
MYIKIKLPVVLICLGLREWQGKYVSLIERRLAMRALSHFHAAFPTFALFALLAAVMSPLEAIAQDAVSFKEDVFPIIELRCLTCHQPNGKGYEASGLDMRTYESLMKGTKFGSVVTPGKAFESNLIAVIDRRTDPKIWMPHNRKRLSKCERLLFRFWVSQGAKDN